MENTNVKEVGIPEISTSAESTLTTVGGIILALGICATLIFACTTLQTETYNGYYHEEQFNPMGLALTLGTLLSSLATWAVLRVIANISLRLKAIQETMPRRLMTEAEVKQVEVEEQKIKENLAKCNFVIGETILYYGGKYEIKNIDITEGKICINLGLFNDVWLDPEKVTKVEV